MVNPVAPVSATHASAPTQIGTSTSISSEPDNAWVAARQSQITADLLALKRAAEKELASRGAAGAPDGTDADTVFNDERQPHHHHGDGTYHGGGGAYAAEEHPTFSGESERIGTRNFDEDTPFGDRVAIL